MKLQKVLAILGISVCLIVIEMQSTFGIEEQAQPEVQEQTAEEEAQEPEEQEQLEEQESEEQEQLEEQEPEEQEQPEEQEPEGQEPEIQEPAAEEPLQPENPAETESSGQGEDGENSGNESGGQGEDGENDGNESGGQGEDGENSGNESGGQDKPGETDKSDKDNAANGSESNKIEAIVPDNTQNIEAYIPNESQTGSIYEYFTPSSEFIDNREKVKYNVELPIDGLPAFITQEMIVSALKCQDETGYPASVTIAQIIQESGFGQYGPNGDKGQGLSYLAYQYNNLFGIKGSGTAGSVAMNTGEQLPDGTEYNITAGFRVYNTYTECIEDRTDLLKNVYSDLIFGVKDSNTFAMKIGKRWATSLSYGQHLIQQMERYDLYRLDEMKLEEFSNMLGIFANPCPGSTLTSDFGYRSEPIAGAGTYHKGIDMGTGMYNIPTYAAQSGIVTYAGECGSAGNLITIEHENGLVTKYMHHDKIYVEVGDHVEKGQQIGLSGTTGNSTGNHLHFQVEKDGVAVDPLPYLNIQK